MNFTQILGLLTAAEPLASSVFLLIKNATGSGYTVVAVLSAADTQIEENQKQLQDWFTSHGMPVPPAATIVPAPQPPPQA